MYEPANAEGQGPGTKMEEPDDHGRDGADHHLENADPQLDKDAGVAVGSQELEDLIKLAIDKQLAAGVAAEHIVIYAAGRRYGWSPVTKQWEPLISKGE